MVTKALAWAPYCGSNFSWKAAAALGVAGLLAACGGGGGGGGVGDTGSTTAPITRAEVQAGDYLVYTVTNTPTVPAGQQPTTMSQTRSYVSIAADGSSQQFTGYSAAVFAGPTTFDVNDGFVGNNDAIGSANIPCFYTPALQSSPPYPRSVGQTWQQTSVRTCSGITNTGTQSGKVVAREQVVVPAGTFDSYKVERKGLLETVSSTTSQTLTCWYSVQRGVTLKCDSTGTQTPVGSTTPNSVISSSMSLKGWGGPNRATLGTVLPRFSGYWRVQYGGGNSGSCTQLMVSDTGGISGNCSAASGGSFAVTGSVNDSGAVDIALPTGGKLTGTLTTPYGGNGTWADSGLTGTWTAIHN